MDYKRSTLIYIWYWTIREEGTPCLEENTMSADQEQLCGAK